MFKKYSENRFRRKFPNLKQVINDQPIDFDMYGQVPLRFGPNQVYMLAEDGRRTVYTEFTVDSQYNYGLKIVYNYPYIIEKIRKPFIITIFVTMLLAIMIQIILTPYIHYVFFFTFLGSLMVYYFSMEYFINKLGISAYKIEVVKQHK